MECHGTNSQLHIFNLDLLGVWCNPLSVFALLKDVKVETLTCMVVRQPSAGLSYKI